MRMGGGSFGHSVFLRNEDTAGPFLVREVVLVVQVMSKTGGAIDA